MAFEESKVEGTCELRSANSMLLRPSISSSPIESLLRPVFDLFDSFE